TGSDYILGMAKSKTYRSAQKLTGATKTVAVRRSAKGGGYVVKDRVGSAVKGTKARYGETLKRLK
ncbi:MAG: hypothetical protein K0U34_08280, partial [Alphaproteobacteria bacterium]|nr:hypothetical protein [Alphaproteobacteria bacterium]